MTITSLNDLMAKASDYRQAEHDDPMLLAVGRLSRSIAVDGTVVYRAGQVCSEPVYEIIPRAYRITSNGGLELTDDHPDWIEAGNRESEIIDSDDIALLIIANTATDTLKTPAEAENVLVYPETIEKNQ